MNPNQPEQPASGVYRWFYTDGTHETTIYVGSAGARPGARRPSTLARGVSELQAGALSSNKGSTLDVDFVVGTALEFFCHRMGLDCHWQHVENDPKEERRTCERFAPVLQSQDALLRTEFRVPKPGGGTWSNKDREMARKMIFRKLDRLGRKEP